MAGPTSRQIWREDAGNEFVTKWIDMNLRIWTFMMPVNLVRTSKALQNDSISLCGTSSAGSVLQRSYILLGGPLADGKRLPTASPHVCADNLQQEFNQFRWICFDSDVSDLHQSCFCLLHQSQLVATFRNAYWMVWNGRQSRVPEPCFASSSGPIPTIRIWVALDMEIVSWSCMDKL